MKDDTSPMAPCSNQRYWKRLLARARPWISRLPLWAIALVLILPVLALRWSDYPSRLSEYFGTTMFERLDVYLLPVALFLPAALRRLSWRQALAMTTFAVATYAFDVSIWGSVTHYPYCLLDCLVPAVGLGEWILNPPRRWNSLVWPLVLTAAVALLIPTFEGPANRTVHVPRVASLALGFRGGDLSRGGADLLYWPLVAVLTWVAIPTACSLSRHRVGAAQWIAGIAAAACVAWFFIFFQFFIYRLAIRSIDHNWPFDRNYALQILNTRRDPRDDLILWKIIEAADWTRRPDEFDFFDYRETCIQILAQRDPVATAQRLSSLLRQKPAALFAEYSAPILAQEHCYEASPELIRYSLVALDTVNPPEEAVESMHIPQAAITILATDAAEHAFIGAINGIPRTSDWTIDSNVRRRLATLLGKDVGSKSSDWYAFYDNAVDKCSTPLSKAQALEVDRVINAFETYWTVSSRLRRAGLTSSVHPPNFDVPGTSALENEVAAYDAQAEKVLRASSEPVD